MTGSVEKERGKEAKWKFGGQERACIRMRWLKAKPMDDEVLLTFNVSDWRRKGACPILAAVHGVECIISLCEDLKGISKLFNQLHQARRFSSARSQWYGAPQGRERRTGVRCPARQWNLIKQKHVNGQVSWCVFLWMVVLILLLFISFLRGNIPPAKRSQ